MKKIFVILTLLCIPSTLFSGEFDEKLHKQCIYPTVAIMARKHNVMGTGVIVRSEKYHNVYLNVILSCAHIIKEGAEYDIVFPTYDKSSIKQVVKFKSAICACSKKYDLSVFICISDKKLPCAELGLDEKLFIGNEVFGVGCGLADQPRLDYGRITSLTDMSRGNFRTSIFTVPGDSGGPVFHNHKLIGIKQAVRALRKIIEIPVFKISLVIPLSKYKEMDKCIEYAYNKDKKLPLLSYMLLYLSEKGAILEKLEPSRWVTAK